NVKRRNPHTVPEGSREHTRVHGNQVRVKNLIAGSTGHVSGTSGVNNTRRSTGPGLSEECNVFGPGESHRDTGIEPAGKRRSVSKQLVRNLEEPGQLLSVQDHAA